MSGETALAQAIDAFKSPSRHRKSVKQLPEGMLDVIKIAAGHEELLRAAEQSTRLPQADVQEAARHFLLALLLDPGARGDRLLGLNPGADPQQRKDHKRWLLKWLHPDRNPSAWESSLFKKINASASSGEHQTDMPVAAATSEKRRSNQDRRRNLQRTWTHAERRVRKGSNLMVWYKMLRPWVFVTLLAGAGIIGVQHFHILD